MINLYLIHYFIRTIIFALFNLPVFTLELANKLQYKR